MTESNNLTYAALITISLPGTDSTATASVVLTSADTVTSQDRTKLLPDCTLADLQQFADEWQAGVWDAYEAINLLSLVEDETVTVAISVLDDDGEAQPLAEEAWSAVRILLDEPLSPPEAELPPAAAVPEDVEEIPIEDAVAAPHFEPPAETAAVTSPEVAVDPDHILQRISISEPELVYEEREALPTAAHLPAIAPSKARVRVAGRRLPLGFNTWAAVDILMDEPAFRAAQAHALSSLNREVAGVLLGPPPEKQPDGRYVVHVIDTIEAKYTVMNGASVTYTPESWRYMNDRLAEKYPDETAVMVGWYHTHPGFGIFLSGMDQFIHQNFFTQIWHIAQVLDPVARTSGFFCWNREKNQVNRVDFPWPSWATGSW